MTFEVFLEAEKTRSKVDGLARSLESDARMGVLPPMWAQVTAKCNEWMKDEYFVNKCFGLVKAHADDGGTGESLPPLTQSLKAMLENDRAQ